MDDLTYQLLLCIPVGFAGAVLRGAALRKARLGWVLTLLSVLAAVGIGYLWRSDGSMGTGRLFCETLLPEGARLNCIGGPEKRFWSAGKNWELDKGFSTRAEKKAQALGVGPYFGNWRLEVSPAAPALDNRFLNVLSAVGTGDAMPRTARLVQDASHDGVTVSLAVSDGTTQNITVLFNRTGAVGGELHRVRRAANGTIVEEESRSLADTVHRQSGVILN